MLRDHTSARRSLRELRRSLREPAPTLVKQDAPLAGAVPVIGDAHDGVTRARPDISGASQVGCDKIPEVTRTDLRGHHALTRYPRAPNIETRPRRDVSATRVATIEWVREISGTLREIYGTLRAIRGTLRKVHGSGSEGRAPSRRRTSVRRFLRTVSGDRAEPFDDCVPCTPSATKLFPTPRVDSGATSDVLVA